MTTPPNRHADRLAATEARDLLDAIVWPDDPRVTQRDVIHLANVILRKHAAPSVQAAFDRVIDRCNQRFHQPGDVDA